MGAPFAGAKALVKREATPCLHIVDTGHSFVDVPNRAGNTAQRIRIGLTGLAFAFLLILLGAVISRSSRDNTPPNAAELNAEMNQPSEPLAELGVAPGADENQQATANNSGGK